MTTALARFISADTIVPGAGSQSWDRYAYVMNNPIRFNDHLRSRMFRPGRPQPDMRGWRTAPRQGSRGWWFYRWRIWGRGFGGGGSVEVGAVVAALSMSWESLPNGPIVVKFGDLNTFAPDSYDYLV